MNNYKISNQQILEILEIARLAPSVHNTQPWLVSTHENSIRIEVDKKHALNDGDPTGRQTAISLGIFCEAIALAASASKVSATAHVENGTGIVSLQPVVKADGPAARRSLDLLKHRASDRSVYRPVPISPSDTATIEASVRGLDANVHIITDRMVIAKIAQLTSNGVGLALSSPSFRNELSHYLVHRWSRKQRGIATSSLYINPLLAALEPRLVKLGIGLKAEVELEKKRWLSASAVIVLLADGDLPKYWFSVGRAYLRASLAIESLGLSQATSAAIVEASNYHEDVEELLHTNQRILALIRIGRGNRVRHYSPRVAATDLLTSRQ